MDIGLINSLTAQQNGGLSGQARPAIPAVRNSNVQEEPVRVAAVERSEVRLSEERRYEAVRKAAQSLFKDAYVVSDTTFTIYKDGTGQYITRFTNLRDGSVTYYPEPEIIRLTESRGESFVEIQA